MKQTDYFTLTQLIIDDVQFPDGSGKKDQLGGGTYTVAGTRIWSDRVGFCCLIGPDYDRYRKWFDENGIHMAAKQTDKNCVHALIDYHEDGERDEILLPGCGSHLEMLPRFTDIPEDYRESRGMYFFKDLDESYWNEAAEWFSRYSGVTCWEIAGWAAEAENRDRIADCAEKVTLLSLNLTEGRRITGCQDPMEVLRTLQDLHAKKLILRMGAKGALAADGERVYAVPAAPANVVDVTGGGNSSTGGLLVGFCESDGDICHAAKCAAVSASFIIEQWSVPERIDEALKAAAEKRLAALTTERLR